MAASPYDTDLDRNPANFQPLTPLTYLERAAQVFERHGADAWYERATEEFVPPGLACPACGGWT